MPLHLSIRVTVATIDLDCDFSSGSYCLRFTSSFNRQFTRSTNTISFALHGSWESDEIKAITIRVFPDSIQFPIHVFTSFPNLQELDISAELSSISQQHFQPAHKLEKLILSANKLEIIPSYVFAGARNLNEIDLSENEINTVEDFAFFSLIHLRKLNLDTNRLTKITRDMFAGVGQLEEIGFDNNLIAEIEVGALTFPNLRILHLDGNQLTTLRDPTFARVPELRALNLQYNKLQYCNNALDPLQKLEILRLARNQINDLDFKKIMKLANLRELSLRNSGFSLDAENVTASDILASKSRIIELDLSACRMQSSAIFFKLKVFPNLEKVNLEDNSLTTIDLRAVRFGGLPKLHTIRIEKGNNFNETWLKETTARLSMSVINYGPDVREIMILHFKG